MQSLSVSAIARKIGYDRKSVRKYLDYGLEAPVYGPLRLRARMIEPYEHYLQERAQTFLRSQRRAPAARDPGVGL